MLDKLKQFKELRDQAKQMKEVLGQETASADSLGGKVSIVINGNQEILAVKISPELLTADKKEELEKGVQEATNDAIKKIQRMIAMKMQQIGGFNFPGMG